MSREELVEAYVDGRMGRRVFIRGLVALGVSTAAALTYADALSASTAPLSPAAEDMYLPNPDDMYPPASESPDAQAGQANRAGGAGAAAPVAARPRFTG